MPSSSSFSLSSRGADLAAGPNMRDRSALILGNQWHPRDNPEGVVNIGTAENHLMLDDLADFIKGKDLNIRGADFDYGEGPWGSSRLRRAMAKFINKYFNPRTPVDEDVLIMSNGCSPIFNMLGICLANPGDGIMLTMPSYVALPNDFGLLGKTKSIFVPFNHTPQFTPNAIYSYEAAYLNAISQGTAPKILLLCNPHNPLGKCYPPETLIALMKFCNSHKIHLIADEIYALSTYEIPDEPAPVPFTSVLAVDWEKYIDKEYFHFVYGLSKDLACGGLRVGCLWSGNEGLMRAANALAGFHWTGTLDAIYACTILEDEIFIERFLDTSRKRLSDANALVRKLLDEQGIEYEEGANAGFYLWINLRSWLREGDGKDDWEREEKLMGRMIVKKVFMLSAGMQGGEEAGWFRLVFSNETDVLREGMSRVMKALKEPQ